VAYFVVNIPNTFRRITMLTNTVSIGDDGVSGAD